jgi:methylphosphotriester-DNA--protein-cysteine methyltransferase
MHSRVTSSATRPEWVRTLAHTFQAFASGLSNTVATEPDVETLAQTPVRVAHGLDLVSTGTKIEAAGLAVGYKSKKDFCRAVQQRVGCTPAQFRARIACG